VSALIASALAAYAGEQPAPTAGSLFQKPAWLTDLSLGVKESYDNNVFLSEVGSLADRDSWVTSVAPKVGFNFAPLLGDQKTLQVLSLGYAPEFVIYHDESSESYNAHRTAATVQGKAGDVSFTVDNGFNYIDGNTDGPIYNKGRSAFGAVLLSTRRAQYQDKGKIAIQYDQEKWFVRPTASLLYFDFLTNLRTTPGYDNYADREDINGGVDFGYKLQPKLALTLGYRYGHQWQQQYGPSIDKLHLSSPNDYQRVLFGVEGKPWNWLTASLQVGPDIRNYQENSPTHTTPVNDKNPVKYYGEGTLTADATANDSFTFKYKQWQWLAVTGKIPYYDSLFDLSYRHKFNAKLSLDLGARLQDWDFTSGNQAASLRDDRQYSFSAGVNYAFTSHFNGNLAYVAELGRNAQDALTDAVIATREFDHHLVSLSFQYKF
jgi:hypothetical protein